MPFWQSIGFLAVLYFSAPLVTEFIRFGVLAIVCLKLLRKFRGWHGPFRSRVKGTKQAGISDSDPPCYSYESCETFHQELVAVPQKFVVEFRWQNRVPAPSLPAKQADEAGAQHDQGKSLLEQAEHYGPKAVGVLTVDLDDDIADAVPESGPLHFKLL
jgi:hypothetical protein